MKKTKIMLTIPYEEVPNEVEKIINRAMTKMASLVEFLRAGTIEDYRKVLNDIETAREKLILVDANLEDAYNILLGYLKNEIDSKLTNLEDYEEEKNEPENI